MTSYAEARDGVRIAYTHAAGDEPALVFIHGGLADRTFWSNQIEAFGARCNVVALDLAGHGESGANRTEWSMQAFGSDVVAVLEAEEVQSAVLVGNSLGGPVAIEAARLVPDRVIGIVGVDTFHDLAMHIDPAEVQARMEEFRQDFAGSVQRMAQALFHADADPELVDDCVRRMRQTLRETVSGMFRAFLGYDMGASVRGLKVPIRCINGDLYPIDIKRNQSLHADFDAVVLPHTGHYPMLECPGEFNHRLIDTLAGFQRRSDR